MRPVFESYDLAKAKEAGRKRVYRVSKDGIISVFVVALSPRHAIGEAGPSLGITAELCDRRPITRREIASLDDFVDSLSDVQKAALRAHLEHRLVVQDH